MNTLPGSLWLPGAVELHTARSLCRTFVVVDLGLKRVTVTVFVHLAEFQQSWFGPSSIRGCLCLHANAQVLRAFVRPAHLDSLTFTLQLGPIYDSMDG